jgi:hypothetical protein
MAQRVDNPEEFQFREFRTGQVSRKRLVRGTRYPWQVWGDGNAWRLWRGVDFTGTIPGIRGAAYAAARARGMRAETQTWQDASGSGIIIQFVPEEG